MTDLVDLAEWWADGTLYSTDRAAMSERFLASPPIAETAPGDFGYPGVFPDGLPFNW